MIVALEFDIPEHNEKRYKEYLQFNNLEDTLENLVDWGLAIQWWGLDLQCRVLRVEGDY